MNLQFLLVTSRQHPGHGCWLPVYGDTTLESLKDQASDASEITRPNDDVTVIGVMGALAQRCLMRPEDSDGVGINLPLLVSCVSYLESTEGAVVPQEAIEGWVENEVANRGHHEVTAFTGAEAYRGAWSTLGAYARAVMIRRGELQQVPEYLHRHLDFDAIAEGMRMERAEFFAVPGLAGHHIFAYDPLG